MKRLLVLSIVVILTVLTSSIASAMDLMYGFYAPKGKYLIELFQKGHPYPSRQDWDLVNYGYGGQYTYKRYWNYITPGRYYFIRVTLFNSNGTRTNVVKQSSAFYIPPRADWYDFGTFNWYYR